MSFANPEAFFLFLPLFAILFWNLRVGVRKRARWILPTALWINDRPRFRIPTPFKLGLVLRFVALSLMIIALARPQERLVREKRTIEAIDMVISFDLSKSMEAVDFRPNRRTVAIEILKNFVDMRRDDRLGLVLFAGEAYLAVPLTTDHELMKQAMEFYTNEGLHDGTAIGESLAVAVNHLKNSFSKSRVIILVTDGDNNMGNIDPSTAAELARGFGIRIYTIGIGKRGIVDFPVEIVDPVTGRKRTIWQQLTDAVNEELLENIARHTGGRAFRAEDPDVLSQIFRTIDSLEKTKVEVESFVRVSEKAWPWILWALLFFMVEMLALNTRWRKLP